MRDTVSEKGTTRKPRSDRGPRLTERDLLAMKWIGEMYAIRFDQLQVFLGRQAKAETKEPGMLSDSAARHTVDRWELAGLAAYKKILADAPGFVWLTAAGVRAAGLPFKRYAPAPAALNHIYWCNQVRQALQMQRPEWSWQSERWLRLELDARTRQHEELPDAYLHTASGAVAVEVELTAKNRVRIAERMRERVLLNPVWYFAPGPVKRGLEMARAGLDEHYRGKVNIYDLSVLT